MRKNAGPADGVTGEDKPHPGPPATGPAGTHQETSRNFTYIFTV